MIASSLAFAVGGAFMKASDGFMRLRPSVMVVAMFVLGAFLLTRAVRTDGLATAYTFGLGVEAILAVIVGMYWFGEHLSPAKVIGIALIIIGVTGVRLG